MVYQCSVGLQLCAEAPFSPSISPSLDGREPCVILRQIFTARLNRSNFRVITAEFGVTAEEIRCVFDDNSKIFFVKSSLKPMLWVLIRIASEAILMSTHNIGFYDEISKIITKLSSNTHLISSAGVK